ncbi:unnamed protein product [Caenorhabditis brenneri]
MNFFIETILNGNPKKPVETELRVPSFPAPAPIIRPIPVYPPHFRQGVEQPPLRTSYFSPAELAQSAILYSVANQLCGAPPPLPVHYNQHDTTLNSILRMQSKIEKMTTVDGAPITGLGHNYSSDSPVMYPSLASSQFPYREFQNVGTTSSADHGMINSVPPVVNDHISPPATPTPPVDMVLYRKAVAHVETTSICQDPRLKLYNDGQQKLFFDKDSSDRVPQYVRRDHPTARWLFENHIRKTALRKKPKRSDFEEKWNELTEEERQEWKDLAHEASAERNYQIRSRFIVQNGLENKTRRKYGRPSINGLRF